MDFALEVLNPLLSPQQSFIGTDDADVIPHHTPDFIPVMADDDTLIWVLGRAGLPLGKGPLVPAETLRVFQDALGATVGEDQSFQK